MANTRLDEPTTPDLFSLADGSEPRAGRPRIAVKPRVPLLPSDLLGALKHLSDEDLQRLRQAADDEALRRNLRVTPLPVAGGVERFSAPPRAKTQKRFVKSKSGTLAPALIKVIRAAVKAGVKPNAVARQFGVSPAAVRLALAEGKS